MNLERKTEQSKIQPRKTEKNKKTEPRKTKQKNHNTEKIYREEKIQGESQINPAVILVPAKKENATEPKKIDKQHRYPPLVFTWKRQNTIQEKQKSFISRIEKSNSEHTWKRVGSGRINAATPALQSSPIARNRCARF